MGDGKPPENRTRRGYLADDRLEEEARSRPGASFIVGGQYTALSFAERLKEVGITLSMALDNSMAESFASTLKAELMNRREFPTRGAAKTAIFEYLETFYNYRRLYSALGYKSPVEFEEDRIG